MYVLALSKTSPTSKYLVFWGCRYSSDAPRSYCECIDQATTAFPFGYIPNSDSRQLLVEESLIEELSIKIYSNGEKLRYVPNCQAVWDALNLEMTTKCLIRRKTPAQSKPSL